MRIDDDAADLQSKVLDTRLRGVNVRCTVDFADSGCPIVSVETRSTSIQQGLRAVSKFAGYCRRTLVLSTSDESEVAWAKVLASYFCFGLSHEQNGRRTQIMAAPSLGPTAQGSAQATFVKRVLALLEHN